MSESIPTHSYDLIDELDKRYPEVDYQAGMGHEAFLLRQGARQLVRSLKLRRDREIEENNHVHGRP